MPGAPGRRGPPDSSRLTSGLAEVSSFRHDKQQDSAIAVFKPGDDVVVDTDRLLAPVELCEAGALAEPGDQVVVDADRLLAPAELSEAGALVAQRCGHLLAHRWRGVLAEPGDQVVVDVDLLLVPIELSEAEALAAQRCGHLLAN